MKFVEILSEFFIMLILLRTPTSELKLMLYMFVLMAIMTDVRSAEPPAPDPIAAEFVLMLIMFAILSEFVPMAIKTEVRSVEPLTPSPIAIAAEFAAMTIILSLIYLSVFSLMLSMFAFMAFMF